MKYYLSHSEVYREDLTAVILAEVAVIATHYKHLLTSRYLIDLKLQNN